MRLIIDHKPCLYFVRFVESKKEKKEKSKKRDSKDLEKESANDVGAENQIEEIDQESPSSKEKKKFGLFRFSGKKSKSSKHGSLDSLKRQSRDSGDFERSGSEFSLEESSGSTESAAAETKEEQASEKTVLSDVEENSENVNLQSYAKTGEVADVALEGSSSEPKNSSTVQPQLVEDKGIDKTAAEQADGEDTSPKEGIPDDKLRNQILNEKMEESVHILETEIVTRNKTDVEELILSTYNERKGPHKDDSQDEETPVNEEAIMLMYPGKQQVDQDHDNNQDDPEKETLVVLAVKTSKENQVEEQINELLKLDADSEESSKQEPADTNDKIASPKSIGTFEVALEDINTVQDREITGFKEKNVDTLVSPGKSNEEDVREATRETEIVTRNKTDVEELILSTYNERKGPHKDDSQDEETPVNEEAIMLMYPGKKQADQDHDKNQDNPEKETLVLLSIKKSKENQVEEQISELLKLDAATEESSKQEPADTNDEITFPKSIGTFDEHLQKFKSESSPFDEKTKLTASTPKRPSTDSERDTRQEAKREGGKALKPVEENIADKGFKESSVIQFDLRVVIVNTIKDVKMSSTELLAQLAEINEKLRALKTELLKLLESGKDEPKKAKTEEVSLQS